MKINRAGLDLIKSFEGWRAEAYMDPVGIATIGYGTTARAGVGIVPIIGMTITKEEGDFYLQQGVNKFAALIEPHITAPINENEAAAFISLAYNIGPNAFNRSSALRHFNNGDKPRAALSILLWNKAGGKVLGGLVRRREAEKALFQTVVAKKQLAAPVVATPIIAASGLLAGIALFWEQIQTFFGGLF